MDEKDIWRAAKLLIDQHGDRAAIEAAMRADSMREAGDMDGHWVWTGIVAAIKELTGGDAALEAGQGFFVRRASRSSFSKKKGVEFLGSTPSFYWPPFVDAYRTFVPFRSPDFVICLRGCGIRSLRSGGFRFGNPIWAFVEA